MNNDTPQVFGEDTHDYPHDPVPVPDQDGEDFPAFRGWAGWGERVEPVAPDDDYPQPSFSPYEPTPYELEYPHRQGPERPGYPQDPSYEPDSGYARALGYPHDPGPDYLPDVSYPDVRYAPDAGYAPDAEYAADADYVAEPGYPPDHGYTADLGFAEDQGYVGDQGYSGYMEDPGLVRDVSPVPLMEPLPDPEQQVVAPASVVAPPRIAQEIAPPQEAALPRQTTRPQEAALPRETARLAADAPLPTRVPQPAPDGYRAFRDEVLAPPPMAEPEFARETSDSLTTESLLHGKRAAPGSGWRRSVYRATGGLLRFGESAAEMRRRDLINRIRTPVAGGHHRVAVLSLKGGVGKTTTAAGLGATLATLRGDRVIAVDANPDRGTLSDKVRLETSATIRDLLNERDQVSRYADVRAFTSQASSRLEVLASDRDPGVSVAFGTARGARAPPWTGWRRTTAATWCGTGSSCCRRSGRRARAPSTSTGSSITSRPAAARWPGSPTTRTWRRVRRWSSSCSAAKPPRRTWLWPRSSATGSPGRAG